VNLGVVQTGEAQDIEKAREFLEKTINLAKSGVISKKGIN
jgi:hypothetical protein